MPAYIPYIGRDYFSFRPRVFCVAINQNLSQHAPWAKSWMTEWAAKPHLAFDRLNQAAQQGKPLPIRPYAEGFIPLIALIAILDRVQKEGGKLPKTLDEVVALTNFVKFSTGEDASSSSIPRSWWDECSARFVEFEIQVLRPDIIIGFGQRTVKELKHILKRSQFVGGPPQLLESRFPARIPSIKARPLTEEESLTWKETILPLVQRIKEPPIGAYHKWKIMRYPGYFIDTTKSWAVI